MVMMPSMSCDEEENSRTQFLNVQTETHQDTPVKGKLLTAVMGEEQSDADPNPGFIGNFIGGV